jgi:hypothetical protein
MSKTKVAHNNKQHHNRSIQYPVHRNGVVFIVVKSNDKQEV